VNRRLLTRALDAFRKQPDESAARRIAYLLACSERLPRALRAPMEAVGRACILCDTDDHAPEGAPEYAQLVRQREVALLDLAHAAVAILDRQARKSTPPE
jgi:hypothetical protein